MDVDSQVQPGRSICGAMRWCKRKGFGFFFTSWWGISSYTAIFTRFISTARRKTIAARVASNQDQEKICNTNWHHLHMVGHLLNPHFHKIYQHSRGSSHCCRVAIKIRRKCAITGTNKITFTWWGISYSAIFTRFISTARRKAIAARVAIIIRRKCAITGANKITFAWRGISYTPIFTRFISTARRKTIAARVATKIRRKCAIANWHQEGQTLSQFVQRQDSQETMQATKQSSSLFSFLNIQEN